MRSFLPFLAVIALSTTGLGAKDDKKATNSAKLADFRISEIISGDKVELSKLQGKVVVLEFWGRNCGPCLAAMPTFNDLHRRYGKKGMQIIGVHAQGGTDEEVLSVVNRLKIKFPIAKGGSSPVSFSGIPHTFVFGVDGSLAFDGHPGAREFEKAVREQMKKVPDEGGTVATQSSASPKPSAAAPADKDSGPLVAERMWTNAEGKTIVASLLSSENGIGKFRLKSGQTTSIVLSKLSAADQQAIKDAEAKVPTAQ